MTRTVAVTGDSGRLGRAVVHALVDDGWELVIFDRVPAPSSPTRFEDAGEAVPSQPSPSHLRSTHPGAAPCR